MRMGLAIIDGASSDGPSVDGESRSADLVETFWQPYHSCSYRYTLVQIPLNHRQLSEFLYPEAFRE